MPSFTQITLYTDSDGRARFKDETLPLNEGTPAVSLSAVRDATGIQFRESPVGFKSQIHCTGKPQWVFILQGQMEIGLSDGTTRVFSAGQHFYSADVLPEGADFDPKHHGHWSAQVGREPLVTLFIKE